MVDLCAYRLNSNHAGTPRGDDRDLSIDRSRCLKEARETVERELVSQALRRHNGKITAAAFDLGISRPTFYELMEKLGIQALKPGA